MKNTLKTMPTIVIGSVIIVLTLLVFFLSTLAPRDTLDWLGLAFVLLSEIVTLGFSIYIFSTLANSSKSIFQAGIFSILTVYWIATVLLALFRNQFANNTNYFILINIILVGIIVIISVLLSTAASRVQILDSKVKLELENEEHNQGKRGGF